MTRLPYPSNYDQPEESEEFEVWLSNVWFHIATDPELSEYDTMITRRGLVDVAYWEEQLSPEETIHRIREIIHDEEAQDATDD
jgi:hypothetical protein